MGTVARFAHGGVNRLLAPFAADLPNGCELFFIAQRFLSFVSINRRLIRHRFDIE
jgi:hypothetical protein